MRKFVWVLAGAVLLGYVSPTVTLADQNGQNAQLVGPGGQQNLDMQTGGTPGDGRDAVAPVPGQDGAEPGTGQSEPGSGGGQTGAESGTVQNEPGSGGGQTGTESGTVQNEPGSGGGQNRTEPGSSQNGISSGGSQGIYGPGSNQRPMDPGYAVWQAQNAADPGTVGEENGDGTLQAAPQIPQNNFLNSAVTDSVVSL